MLSKKLVALAALSMMVGSTAAVAQSAAPISSVRASASVEDSSNLNGELSPFLGIAVIALAVILAFLLSDGDRSTSP